MILTLTIYARETCYNGVIKPTLMYGSTVWDSCCAESLQRVSQASEEGGKNFEGRRQKNAIDHALFHKLKQSLIKRLTLIYNQLDNNFSAPIYIDSLLLIRNSDIHQRETRYSDLKLLCPKYTRKTEGGRTTVRTIAVNCRVERF